MIRKPPIKTADPGIISEPDRSELDNGIPVYLINAGTEDIVRVEFSFSAGNVSEQIPLSALATNQMLTEGSRYHGAAAINRVLDFHGVYYHLYCDRDRAGLVIFCTARHLAEVIGLAAEILFEPLFPPKELKALMKKRLHSFTINRAKVSVLAADSFFESVFGTHHPYGRPTQPEDFNNITSLILKEFHSAYYKPENMAVIAAGRIPHAFAGNLNNVFGKLRFEKIYIEKPASFFEGKAVKKTQISKEGALQSAIRIGSATINKRHEDYPALKIVNVILGGYFGSRLMKNLREDKGYTYGISSSVSSLNLSGYKVISAEVSKKITQQAIDEIYREIRILQTVPVEKEELKMVKNYMLGEMVRMFDGPFARAESFRSVWEFGLDYSYYRSLAEKIKSIQPDEIMSIAKTYYNTEELYEITAG